MTKTLTAWGLIAGLLVVGKLAHANRPYLVLLVNHFRRPPGSRLNDLHVGNTGIRKTLKSFTPGKD